MNLYGAGIYPAANDGDTVVLQVDDIVFSLNQFTPERLAIRLFADAEDDDVVIGNKVTTDIDRDGTAIVS
ncbi:MAG: hypothetical protein ACPGXK_17240, partial [Phycisphaerae bacterium]